MTKAAALELGRHNIRVNSIHPGGIDTAMGNPLDMDNIVGPMILKQRKLRGQFLNLASDLHPGFKRCSLPRPLRI